MRTGNIEYTRHIYKQFENLKSNTKYKLVEVANKESSLLTDIVRIEKDNGYHSAKGFAEWLFLRTTKNWKTCEKTGLRAHIINNIFEGNIPKEIYLPEPTFNGKPRLNPVSFIIAQFSEDKNTLILDVFDKFYPCTPHLKYEVLKQHQYYIK